MQQKLIEADSKHANAHSASWRRLRQLAARPWVPAEQGRMPYLWMFSLLFLLWQYFYVAPTALEKVCLVLTVLVFVPMYLASFWTSDARSLLYVLLTCLLGLLWARHNFGASCFFIFAAGMCGPVLPVWRAYAMVAMVLVLGLVGATLVQFEPIGFLVPTMIVGLPIGVACIMDASLKRTHRQLSRKQEEVEHIATIAERERISRDLHDLLGHTLSLIALKAELAGKLGERDMTACMAEIKDIEHSARHALSEVRSAVSGYRQTGFAHELGGARISLAAAGVALASKVQTIAMPAPAENVMSLALREAVTNIVRHAGATRCELSLALEQGMIVLRIADNGGTLHSAAQLRHGNGLSGMQERISALDGVMALRVEQGLALELRLPMAVPA